MEGLRLEPNHVYVAPPNLQLTCADGVFHLSPIIKLYGCSEVMNVFLQSLAQQWRFRAVAVILSGMDADGAQALKAVKEAGGITFAQDLETAEYCDMPRNAIQTGFVDFVLTPQKIAAELLRLAQRHAADRYATVIQHATR
jgi:chemotaxis response regulator CheB